MTSSTPVRVWGVVCVVCCRAALAGGPDTPVPGGPEARAKAWAAIAAIRDESVQTLAWRDRVIVHQTNGPDVPMADYEVRSDDLRNLRVVGEEYFLRAGEALDKLQRKPLVLSNVDGVMRILNFHAEGCVGLVRVEKPDVILPWCIPSPVKGVGRVPNVVDIRSRADYLRELPDLRVEAESPGESIVLTGTELGRARCWIHRVEIDPATGCVRRHQAIDPVWGALAVDWAVVRRADFGPISVPTRVEFRIYELNVDKETLAALWEARDRAGLNAAAMRPDSDDYGAWVRLRDEFFKDKPPPLRPYESWQSCDAQILSLNQRYDRSAFDLPDRGPVVRIFSDALECGVDRMELEPSSVDSPPGS